MGHFASKNKVTPASPASPSSPAFSQKESAAIPSTRYYTERIVSHIDYIHASVSWKYILDGTGRHFVSLKHQKKISERNCTTWFYKILYRRLFTILPEVESMFHGGDPNVQSKMMIKMITDMLESYYNPKMMTELRNLALRHMGYGVHSYHFIIMGDALFYTLKRVLGADYTTDCDAAWKRIYSSVLRVVVPLYNEKEENRVVNQLLAECCQTTESSRDPIGLPIDALSV